MVLEQKLLHLEDENKKLKRAILQEMAMSKKNIRSANSANSASANYLEEIRNEHKVK
jgi:hypothetical protein